MVIKEGLDFKSLDGNPTYLFFMIGAPKDSGGAHLQALAQLSTLLMEEDFRNALIHASSKEEFLQLIDAKENNKEEVKEVVHPDVLAVTACPTGIAHTFMAAKALEQAGEKLNISIKVFSSISSKSLKCFFGIINVCPIALGSMSKKAKTYSFSNTL